MHPDTAAAIFNLANVYRDQGKFADAEPLFLQSLEINEEKNAGCRFICQCQQFECSRAELQITERLS